MIKTVSKNKKGDTEFESLESVIHRLIKVTPSLARFRHAYDGRGDEVSLAALLVIPEGEGRTKQAFKDECDVNNILREFGATGVMPHVREVVGRYGDFTDQVSYEQALDTVVRAQMAFEELPSKIRERFQNDPSELMAFLGDEKNRDEAISLGLVEGAPPSTAPRSSAPQGAREQSDPPAAVMPASSGGS